MICIPREAQPPNHTFTHKPVERVLDRIKLQDTRSISILVFAQRRFALVVQHAFPRYRRPGETHHPTRQTHTYNAPAELRSGGGHQIGVQHHANLSAQQVEQDGDPLAFRHALKQTEA